MFRGAEFARNDDGNDPGERIDAFLPFALDEGPDFIVDIFGAAFYQFFRTDQNQVVGSVQLALHFVQQRMAGEIDLVGADRTQPLFLQICHPADIRGKIVGFDELL